MPLPLSQDVDARFAIFLNPIRDLTKNWEVDIAKYLEEYLIELAEIQITFDGGETTMNFAEAAMLIQGTATVYSKKVEFLWQMVLEMLDLLSSKKCLENKDQSDDSKVSDGNRSSKSKETLDDFSKLDYIKEGKNIDLKEDDVEEQSQKNSFRFLPAIPLHLVEKEGEKSHMKIALYLKNMEIFGYKDDFRINRSYLTPEGLLCLELPQEILMQRVCPASRRQSGLNDSIAGFIPREHFDQLTTQGPLVSTEDDNVSVIENDNIDDVDDAINSDHELEAIHSDSTDLKVIQQMNSSTAISKHNLQTRNKEAILEKPKILDKLKPQDPHTETPANRPTRIGRLRKPMACLCHCATLSKKRSRKSNQNNKEKKKIQSVESFIIGDLVNLISSNNNNTKKEDTDIAPCLITELAKEISDKAKSLHKFRSDEIFAQDNSLTEQEIQEKINHEDELKEKDDDLNEDAVPDLEFDAFQGGDNEISISLPTPHNEFAFDDLIDTDLIHKNLNDSIMYEPSSDYEALVQKWVSEYVTSAQEHIASSELTKRVNEWRKNISPKLIDEENRKHFDIHAYGSFILSKLPDKKDIESYISFEDIVRGESANEVSRIFLSSLMLANTCNISLSQTREGEMEMDCLQMSLISRVRHHEELDLSPTSPRMNKKKFEKPKRKNQ